MQKQVSILVGIIIVVVAVVVSEGVFYVIQNANPYEVSWTQEKSQNSMELAPNQPYIKIITPNGSEIYKYGKDIIVKWTSQNVDKVDILAVYYNSSNIVDSNNSINKRECKVTKDPVLAASETFTIVGGDTGKCGILSADTKIKFFVYGAGQSSAHISDFSDNYFSITK